MQHIVVLACSYCVCELPYNPDAFMILCGKCDEWWADRPTIASALAYRTSQWLLRAKVHLRCNRRTEKPHACPQFPWSSELRKMWCGTGIIQNA